MSVNSDTVPLAVPLALMKCPYRGLLSYSEAEHTFFFGRERDTDLVVANMLANRVSVLCGPSGVGKSSLLQAGVLHELRHVREGAFSFLAADHVVAVYFAAWRDDPLGQLGRAVCDALPIGSMTNECLTGPPRLSAELLSEIVEKYNADVYLILDQVEELVLYQQGESCESIALELSRIVRNSNLRASVLFGVREDALAQLELLERHIPGLFNSVVRLDHLSAEGARQAIECPLERFNQEQPQDRRIQIEPQLVDRLLTDLRTGRVAVTETGSGVVAAGTTTIETPFLQLVMKRLWNEEVDRAGVHKLRLATLDRLAGAQNIVRTHLDHVMNELTDAQRDVAAKVFRYLVTPSGSKIAHSPQDLAYFSGASDFTSLNQLLEELSSGEHRVLRPVPPPVDHPGPTRYEIFHDVMAPAILDWRRRYVDGQERRAAERELVAARQAAEDRIRETRTKLRRARLTVGALVVLLVAGLTAGMIAFVKWREASDLQHEAARNEKLAVAGENLDTDPAVSLHNALEAWDARHDARAEVAVRSAFGADLNRLIIGAGHAGVTDAEFSPAGSQILVAAGDDDTARVFDSAKGHLTALLIPDQSEPNAGLSQASFSPDGTMVATSTDNGVVTVFDADTGSVVAHSDRMRSDYSALFFWAGDGAAQRLLISGDGRSPEVWTPRSSGPPITLGNEMDFWFWQGAIREDGSTVSAVGVNKDTFRRMILVWDARTGEELARTPVDFADAYQPTFVSKDSNRLAFVAKNEDDDDYSARLWDPAQPNESIKNGEYHSRFDNMMPVSIDAPRQPGRTGSGLLAFIADSEIDLLDSETLDVAAVIPQQESAMSWVEFNADGSLIATGLDNGVVTVWDSRNSNPLPVARLAGHDARVTAIDFSESDPGVLLSSSADGTVRTWRLPQRTVFARTGTGWMQDADVVQVDGKPVLIAANHRGEWAAYDEQLKGTEPKDLVDGALVYQAALSPDASLVAMLAYPRRAPVVWDRTTEKYIVFDHNESWLQGSLQFNGTGTRIVAVDGAGDVVVWDSHTGDILDRIAIDHQRAISAIFIPGGDRIAVIDDNDRLLIVRSSSEGPQVAFTQDRGAQFKHVTVSADGSQVAIVTEDRKMYLHSLTDGTTRELDGLFAIAPELAFSPAGDYLAAAARNGSVYVWSTSTGLLTGVLHVHADLVNSVAFMPDGKKLVTASDDGTAVVSDCGFACAPIEQVIDQARDRDSERSAGG